ncbi:bifunctional riboflavin kinase/FMN adenylyltransferase [Gammaproteobacteria bacterium]
MNPERGIFFRFLGIFQDNGVFHSCVVLAMQVIRGLHNLRPAHRGCVATLGNFDGVHLGHLALFRHLMARGKALALPSLVITFEPQPLEFLDPASSPSRLTRLREKAAVIAETGIDRLLVLPFGPQLANLAAEVFVESLLVEALAIRLLLVGDDFRFGRGRSGDFALLKALGIRHGFDVERLSTLTCDQQRISSTRIREALTSGRLGDAADCLGRPYRMCGRVVHGSRRGRQLGFPTANLDLHRRVSPLQGVFAVWVHGLGTPRPGVANLGHRPTIDAIPKTLLEVHLLDFSGDLYGTHLAVEFFAKLRNERRFPSLEALQQQMASDAAFARTLLGIPPTLRLAHDA